MAELRWTKDTAHYKKGDKFEYNGPSLDELLKSGDLELVKKEPQVHIAQDPKTEPKQAKPVDAETTVDENPAPIEVKAAEGTPVTTSKAAPKKATNK